MQVSSSGTETIPAVTSILLASSSLLSEDALEYSRTFSGAENVVLGVNAISGNQV